MPGSIDAVHKNVACRAQKRACQLCLIIAQGRQPFGKEPAITRQACFAAMHFSTLSRINPVEIRRYSIAFLALLLVGPGAPCRSASLSGYATSDPVLTFQDGVARGLETGRTEGYQLGAEATIGTCQADPSACGISLGACLTAPEFGETEPNDNIVTADVLLLDTKFWGQSYGIDDADWFFVTTERPNQSLIVNFAVPNGSVAGWNLSIRDAAGNTLAQFDTGSVSTATSAAGDITYRVTLGLVGTYYIVLQPRSLRYDPYTLAALIQDTPLETKNFVVGFNDVETEPNNLPGQWNLLSTGVTMFGTMNLSFAPGTVVPDADGSGYEYSQAVDQDWFLHQSRGNEVLTISVCNRQECTKGNWLFQLYDEASANIVATGNYAAPLLAFNSDTGGANQYSAGIQGGGNYFLRVTHKRLLSAQCADYRFAIRTDETADQLACRCDGGVNDCEQSKVIQGQAQGALQVRTGSSPDGAPAYTYYCPNGTAGTVLNPPPEGGFATDANGYGDTLVCDLPCQCASYRGTIEVPKGALTSQYNFTLHSTQLPPATGTTDAYQDFIDRPNPFAP